MPHFIFSKALILNLPFKFFLACCVLLFLFPVISEAGLAESKTGLAEKDTIPGKKHLGKIVFNFDTRYSFIDDETVRINGIKLGMEWREKWRTGLGIYFLSSSFNQDVDRPAIPGNEFANLRFRYFVLYGEYIFLRNRKWELSAPMQAGMGSMFYRFNNELGQEISTDKQLIYLVEPSVAAHYKIFYWLGLGAGFGYRQVLNADSSLAHDLDEPIYYGKVKLFLGELYKEYVRKKHARKS